MTSLSLFAVTAPGLEPLAEAELREMGIEAKAEPGGVAWEGDQAQMQAANLRLRTASRVLVRVAEFKARAFYEMERHTDRIAWERFVGEGSAVRVRVTSSKSKLYHEGAIEERILRSIGKRVGGITGLGAMRAGEDEEDDEVDVGSEGPGPVLETSTQNVDAGDPAAPVDADGADRGARHPGGRAMAADPDAPAPGRDPDGARTPGGDEAGAATEAGEPPAQMFVVRFHRDRCTISADSSGELLHRRGYRLAVARAPLRETLACAMLRASGWPGDAPLLDPLCGAGTVVIEAALMARRIAPGLARADRAPRRYSFEQWPEHDAAGWADVVERAVSEILDAAPAPIQGSDRDAGAVEAALANAARAGVAGDVEITERVITAVAPPPGPGWLVTNPPYGHRVGDADRLRNLYAALGRVARERLGGWTVALLSADPRLDAQTGISLDEVVRTRNGGIPVRVAVGRA